MSKVTIRHQDRYSRGELLLRSFFGWLYMILPHIFILYFVMIGVLIVNFLAFWIILFTGKYPQGMWNFVMNFLRWQLRLTARIYNLSDGYPAFGLGAHDDATSIELEYPQSSNRVSVLLRTLFGFIYVMIPHGLCLMFLSIAAAFVQIITWFIVLFTAQYPKGLHEFMTGVIRWSTKVNLYMFYLTDEYPPFSLAETNDSNKPLDQDI